MLYAQIYLLYSVPTSASVRAKTYCAMTVLDRVDFRAVVDRYPDGELYAVVCELYAVFLLKIHQNNQFFNYNWLCFDEF